MINALLFVVLIGLLIYWHYYRDWIDFSKAADEIMSLALDRLQYEGVLTLSLEDIHAAIIKVLGHGTLKEAEIISRCMFLYFSKYTTCKVQGNQRGDLSVQILS